MPAAVRVPWRSPSRRCRRSRCVKVCVVYVTCIALVDRVRRKIALMARTRSRVETRRTHAVRERRVRDLPLCAAGAAARAVLCCRLRSFQVWRRSGVFEGQSSGTSSVGKLFEIAGAGTGTGTGPGDVYSPGTANETALAAVLTRHATACARGT